MDRLPFGSAAFDLVIMLDVLEHFADGAAALQRRPRGSCGRDGAVLVSVPAFQAPSLQRARRRLAARSVAHGFAAAASARGKRVRRAPAHVHDVAALGPAAIVRGLLPRLGVRRPAGTAFRVQRNG